MQLVSFAWFVCHAKTRREGDRLMDLECGARQDSKQCEIVVHRARARTCTPKVGVGRRVGKRKRKGGAVEHGGGSRNLQAHALPDRVGAEEQRTLRLARLRTGVARGELPLFP